MDRGAWRAAVHGVAKSRTRLSDFTSRHVIEFNKVYNKIKRELQRSLIYHLHRLLSYQHHSPEWYFYQGLNYIDT